MTVLLRLCGNDGVVAAMTVLLRLCRNDSVVAALSNESKVYTCHVRKRL